LQNFASYCYKARHFSLVCYYILLPQTVTQIQTVQWTVVCHSYVIILYDRIIVAVNDGNLKAEDRVW